MLVCARGNAHYFFELNAEIGGGVESAVCARLGYGCIERDELACLRYPETQQVFLRTHTRFALEHRRKISPRNAQVGGEFGNRHIVGIIFLYAVYRRVYVVYIPSLLSHGVFGVELRHCGEQSEKSRNRFKVVRQRVSVKRLVEFFKVFAYFFVGIPSYGRRRAQSAFFQRFCGVKPVYTEVVIRERVFFVGVISRGDVLRDYKDVACRNGIGFAVEFNVTFAGNYILYYAKRTYDVKIPYSRRRALVTRVQGRQVEIQGVLQGTKS